LDTGDIFLADDVAGHAIFALADDHQILGPADDRAYRGKAADDPHVRFACEHGRCPRRTRGDEDELDVETLLLEETDFLGDPHGRHRGHGRSVECGEALRLCGTLVMQADADGKDNSEYCEHPVKSGHRDPPFDGAD
jgi:hypothetical protein